MRISVVGTANGKGSGLASRVQRGGGSGRRWGGGVGGGGEVEELWGER